MRISQNTTALDVAYNLSGSLTGLPAVLAQLPVGKRIGFDDLPEIWQDVDDIGQTWTPDLQGKYIDLDVRAINRNVDGVLNERAVRKAPYTTDLFGLQTAIDYGMWEMEKMFTPPVDVYSIDEIEVGTNIKGWKFAAINTDKPMPINIPASFGSNMQLSDGGNVVALSCGIRPTIRDLSQMLSNAGRGTVVKEHYHFLYGWLEREFTVPNDKDYIVTENGFFGFKGTPTEWGFGDFVRIIE